MRVGGVRAPLAVRGRGRDGWRAQASIVTLLQAYAPHAATAAFAAEAARFHDYASAWRDRWNSVMEMFMAGGGDAVAGTPFPAHFPDAVQLELAASR